MVEQDEKARKKFKGKGLSTASVKKQGNVGLSKDKEVIKRGLSKESLVKGEPGRASLTKGKPGGTPKDNLGSSDTVKDQVEQDMLGTDKVFFEINTRYTTRKRSRTDLSDVSQGGRETQIAGPQGSGMIRNNHEGSKEEA